MRGHVDRRICGNCQYWSGDRSPTHDQYGVPKNEMRSDRGICQCERGNFNGHARLKDQKCVRFEKWYELP